MTTPVSRSQNLDRRDSGQPHTTLMSALIGTASNESTVTTTFMVQC